MLFRIVQELLSNSIKHSGGNHLSVQIKATPDLCITIADNGVGNSPEKQNIDSGMGIKNIRKRIALIGGRFEIHTSAIEGTRVTIHVPHA
jgi:signal transduction histidine kinase